MWRVRSDDRVILPAKLVLSLAVGHHEAAHIVAGLACGLDTTSARVDGEGGVVYWREATPADAVADLFGTAAGEQAEWMYLRMAGHGDLCSATKNSSDHGHLKAAADRLVGGDAVLRLVQAAVAEWLHAPGTWDAIAAVARLLMERRSVGWNDIHDSLLTHRFGWDRPAALRNVTPAPRPRPAARASSGTLGTSGAAGRALAKQVMGAAAYNKAVQLWGGV